MAVFYCFVLNQIAKRFCIMPIRSGLVFDLQIQRQSEGETGILKTDTNAKCKIFFNFFNFKQMQHETNRWNIFLVKTKYWQNFDFKA